jgi:Ca2+-binding RTX toxin-like protein
MGRAASQLATATTPSLAKSGDDMLTGGDGADRIEGNRGSGRLIGGSEPDVVRFAPGGDVLVSYRRGQILFEK